MVEFGSTLYTAIKLHLVEEAAKDTNIEVGAIVRDFNVNVPRTKADIAAAAARERNETAIREAMQAMEEKMESSRSFF